MRDILAILLIQSALGCALAAIVWLTVGGDAAAAALLGTGICVLSHGFLAARLLLSPDARLLRALWLGEIGKIALTVVLFGGVLATLQPPPLWLLLGYIVAQLGTFSGLLLPSDKRGA
ncbi:MAG: ATP synthase subunit I [Pseudomonadota bacterium]